MKPFTSQDIESLLEQMGSTQMKEEPVHRYELRRKLLCSKYYAFSDSPEKWLNMAFTYGGPMIIGGMTISVFAFLVQIAMVSEIQPGENPSSIHLSGQSSTPLSSERQVESTDFLSPSKELESRSLRFIPLASHDFVMTQ